MKDTRFKLSLTEVWRGAASLDLDWHERSSWRASYPCSHAFIADSEMSGSDTVRSDPLPLRLGFVRFATVMIQKLQLVDNRPETCSV